MFKRLYSAYTSLHILYHIVEFYISEIFSWSYIIALLMAS